MASAGLTQNDVNVQQVGPTGVWQFVAEGKSVRFELAGTAWDCDLANYVCAQAAEGLAPGR